MMHGDGETLWTPRRKTKTTCPDIVRALLPIRAQESEYEPIIGAQGTALGHGNAVCLIACQLFIQIKSIIVIVRTRNGAIM